MMDRAIVLRLNGDLYFVGLAGKPHDVKGAFASRELLEARLFGLDSAELRDAEFALRGEGIPYRRQYVGLVGNA